MHFPDWLTAAAPLTFGRIRPAHLNAMSYGWASLAMIGVSVWRIPRLVHAELRWGRAAVVGVALWDVGLVLGIGGILAGRTDGLE